MLCRDGRGRLGIKISGNPSGIYVETVDRAVVRCEAGELRQGDRILAVAGRSVEHLSYHTALDTIRSAGPTIQFTVSQLR